MKKAEKIVNESLYNGQSPADRINELNIPGMSIAIIENNEISCFSYGVKNNNNDKISSNTLFQAGSLSKPFFATTIMRLVEKDVLDLEIDINSYLKEQLYNTFDNKEYKINLKQILSHRAGFNINAYSGYKKDEKIPFLHDIIKGINNQVILNQQNTKPTNSTPVNHGKLDSMLSPVGMCLYNNVPLFLERLPDSEYVYSGGGYALAQKIVEDVINKPFSEIANDEIIKPLSLTKSNYNQPLKNENSRDFACGFYDDGTQIEHGYFVAPVLSEGGLWTTPSEYAQFIIELINVFNNQSAFIKKESLNIMLNQTGDNIVKAKMGLGFVVGNCKKGTIIGHTGAAYGYRSSMRFCLDNRTGFVIMQNVFDDTLIKEITKAFIEVFDW